MVRDLQRYFLTLLIFPFLAMAASAFAQPDVPKLMPVSRLAEIKDVRWMALKSSRKEMVRIDPTLTKSAARLKMMVPGYEVGTVRQDSIQFSRFDVPGAGVTPVVGKPELPVMRRFVAIPDGARVRVKFNTGNAKVLKNVTVYPVQEPLPEQPLTSAQTGQMRKFAFNRNFYKTSQNYPAKLVTVSKPMKIRNVTVVLVEMAAMQYNPGRKTLSVYPELDVSLSFSKPFEPVSTGMKPILSRNTKKLRIDKKVAGLKANEGSKLAVLKPSILKLSDKIYLNKDWIKAILAHLKWNYLIITPDVYYDEIQPLATWKRGKGLSVHVTKLSSIGAAPTVIQIRDYIKKAYENHAVEYVLLVGDTDTLPGYNYPGGGGTISDYYYTLVSGADSLPDLALGRFSGRSKTEISHMVSKSVNYEKTPATGAWKTRALCVSDSGYFQDTSNYIHGLLESNGFTADKLYASLGNATSANVTSAVNNGRLLVSYRGHGSQTGWSTTGFSNANVNALANGTRLPVIISPTCLTGCYDYAVSDCYSETWVKSYGASAPLGAAAYWGSARISYGGYNDELAKGAFEDLLTNGDHVIGNVVNNAKLHMISHYGVADGTALLELYMFNLFGDPELQVNF
ncbi:MAG: C25 family cysteine peptidase [Geobacteraceae bacterium]